MKGRGQMGRLALAGLLAATAAGVRAQEATDRSGDALENRPASKATPGPQTGDDGFQLPADQERPGATERNRGVQEQSGQGTRQQERIERRARTTEREEKNRGSKHKRKGVKSRTKTETRTQTYEPENR